MRCIANWATVALSSAQKYAALFGSDLQKKTEVSQGKYKTQKKGSEIKRKRHDVDDDDADEKRWSKMQSTKMRQQQRAHKMWAMGNSFDLHKQRFKCSESGHPSGHDRPTD